MLDRHRAFRHPALWFGVGALLSWLARVFVFDASVRAELSGALPATMVMKLLFVSVMMAAVESGLFASWLQCRLGHREPPGWPNPGVPVHLGLLWPWLCLAAGYLSARAGSLPALTSQLISAAVLIGPPIAFAEVVFLLAASRREQKTGTN